MTSPAPPSPFILEQIDSWLATRPGYLAKQPFQLVDLACGSGRHIKEILGREYENAVQITAVDIDSQSLEMLISSVDSTADITPVCLDLESEGLDLGEALSGRLFDLVLVTNYLHRPSLGQIFRLVRPGGLLLYETFGQGNADFGRPSNPDFLLKEGELACALPEGFAITHQFFGQRQDIYPERPPAIICQFATQRRHGQPS